MSFVAASGTSGAVLVGTVSYAFKDWSLSMDAKLNETSNFNTGGYRTFISGLIGGDLSCSGPYDIGPVTSGGNMPLVAGASYSFTLKVNSTVTFIVTALVGKIDVKTDVDGIATVNVTGKVNGAYTAAIV